MKKSLGVRRAPSPDDDSTGTGAAAGEDKRGAAAAVAERGPALLGRAAAAGSGRRSYDAVPVDVDDGDVDVGRCRREKEDGTTVDDGGIVEEPVEPFVYLMAGCAALNSCNLGFDIGVNTDAGLLIKESMDVSDVQLEMFMGSINLFALIGALLTSRVASAFGLRGSFVVAAGGFLLGLLLQISAGSYRSLMFGRVFVGLGVGFGFAVGPMFISEVSPRAHRGYFVSWAEIGCNVGILLGFATGFLSYALPADAAWRAMFAFGCIMPLGMIVLAVAVMSESPRWLAQKERYAEARAVLGKLYPEGHDVESELSEIRDAIEEESALSRRVGWGVLLFPTPSVRRMLLVGVGTAVCQQMSGIDAVQYYLVFILEESGITNRLQQANYLTALGFLKLSCIFIAGPLFDKHGRRPLMFVSLLGMAAANFVIASTFYDEADRSGAVLLGLASYLAFFSLGIGPLAWVIPAEIFSQQIRAKAVSATTFVNRLTATFVSSSMLSVADAITWGGYFVLLGVMCLLICAFFFLFLPETKGRGLEEMGRYFAELTHDASILHLGEATEADTDEEEQEEEGFGVELVDGDEK